MQFGLKQFRDQCCLSYLIHNLSAEGGAGPFPGILIDPCVALLGDYRQYLAEKKIRLVCIVDTHTHSEHHSASHILSRETGAPVAMAAGTLSARPGRKLNHRDEIEIGNLRFEVLKTPGHTSDSVSLFGHGMLFSGDALLIGPSTPPELADADPVAQWTSFQEVFARLPSSTLVFPAHDANEILFSLIEVEHRKNALWSIQKAEEFLSVRRAVQVLRPAAEVDEIIKFNLEAAPAELPVRAPGRFRPYGEPEPEFERMAAITISKLVKKVRKPDPGSVFLDVREPEEFREGRIPQSVNVPLSDLPFKLPELAKARRVYVCGNADSRSDMAARTLNYIGLPDVIHVEGGVRAWSQAGMPVEEG